MENLKIRKITLNDIDQLREIGRQTFAQTYASYNSEENMKEYLNSNFSTEVLKTELTNNQSEFYFAELADKVIGYLKMNFGHTQTEIKGNHTLEIERIYVLKEFHGKKIGQKLYEKAIEIAKQKMVDHVWLGVWEQNPRAISFYKKNGFIEYDTHIFTLGSDEQTDILMKLSLKY